MKVVILLALVASCFAAPVLRADYAAVAAKVVELEALVKSSLDSVVADALSEDQQVGASIGSIAAAGADKAKVILAEANELIAAETLTVEQAEGYLKALEALLLQVQADCKPETAKLSQATQDKITKTFTDAYLQAKAIAEAIYALLGGKSTRAADYAAVAAKVVELEALVKSSLDSVVADALSEDQQVGASIGSIAAAGADKAKVILAEANELIAAETLTVEQAEGYLKALEALLLQVQADCKPETAKLSQATQDKITKTFTDAYLQAKAIAEAIYALLAGRSTRAADYAAVAAKVVELEALVKSSLDSVVADALSEDQQVGASIGSIAAAGADKAKVILAEANELIAAETLTVEQAEGYLKALEALLLQVQADCKPETAKLSQATQDKITKTFTDAYLQAKAIAEAIYALLAGKSTRAADYAAVAAKVVELEALVKSSLDSVVADALSEDQQVGASIGSIAAAGADKAKVILAEANELIAAETLTVEQAEGYLKALEALLLQVQADCKPETAKLSQATQDKITKTFTDAYLQAKAIAEAIYALLAGKSTRAADYAAVAAKVVELEALVKSSLDSVVADALSEDQQVGASIGSIAAAGADKAKVILAEANELIAAETLTVEQAEGYLKALEALLLQVQADCKPETAKLSQATQDKITKTFTDAYLQAKAIAEAIYALLAGKSTRAADYAAVAAKVVELEALVKSSLDSVVADALSEDQQVGASIGSIAAAGADKAKVILAEANELIAAETLTVEQAEGYLKALEALLLQVQADCKPETAKLSQATQDKITKTFTDAYLQAKAIAEAIYALLAGKSTRAADYAAVAAKVVELEALVKSSLDSVVADALSEDQQVGASIGSIAAAGADKAKVILAEANELIAAETLTVEQAEGYLKALEALLLQVQADCKPETAKLSQATQDKITKTFTDAYLQAKAIAEAIYALLAGKSTRAADYAAVAAKVVELEALVKSSLDSVVADALSEDQQVGASIGSIAAAGADKAKVILAEANELIAAETLTVEQAEGYLKALEALLLQVQADCKPETAKLSQATQDKITKTFTDAYLQAKAIAEAIYALLV